MTLSPGTRLGSYELTDALGAGGMGEVYRARDVRGGREVAVKVLPGDASRDGESRARFEREARGADRRDQSDRSGAAALDRRALPGQGAGRPLCFDPRPRARPEAGGGPYFGDFGRGATSASSLRKDIDYPTWSPDGKRIAFQPQRGAIREIWVVPAQGGEPRPLTRDLEDSHPAWSPINLDEILFLRDHKRLAIVAVSSGKVRLLPSYSEGSYILDYPSWSRDGKRIYFSVSRKTGDIYVLEGL